MEELKTKRELDITQWLMGKKITGVTYYLMNRDAYLHPDSPIQLIDAGVQLELNNNEYVTFGWNFEFAILDMHAVSFVDKLKSFNHELPYLEKPANADAQWKELIGATVEGVRFAWNWFIDMDEKTHYVPQDIEILLSDGKYIAICTTAYSVNEEGITIAHPDSEGELLVLFSEEDTKFYKRGSYYESPAESPEAQKNNEEEFF
ncbi:MAG: hypothetical protein ACHQF2_03055 [Flavobacteriales bacterium]